MLPKKSILNAELAVEEWNDVKKIYNFAMSCDKEKSNKNIQWLTYNLRSANSIETAISSGSKYYVLTKKGKPVSIIAVIKGFPMLPIDKPDKNVFNKDLIEIGAMLTTKKERNKGFIRILLYFLLKELYYSGVKYVHIVIKGDGNINKKGIPCRDSKPIDNLCKKLRCQVIGYGTLSFGPIYRIKLPNVIS